MLYYYLKAVLQSLKVCPMLHLCMKLCANMRFNMAVLCHLTFVLGSRGTIRKGSFM